MGNPYLIAQINHYFKTGEGSEYPSLSQQIEWCQLLGDSLIASLGETRAMRIYRSIAPKFFNGFPGAKSIKIRLATELVDRNSLDQILKTIQF